MMKPDSKESSLVALKKPKSRQSPSITFSILYYSAKTAAFVSLAGWIYPACSPLPHPTPPPCIHRSGLAGSRRGPKTQITVTGRGHATPASPAEPRPAESPASLPRPRLPGRPGWGPPGSLGRTRPPRAHKAPANATTPPLPLRPDPIPVPFHGIRV